MEVKTKKQRIYIALTLLSAVFSVGSCDYVGKYLGELKQDERNPAVARVDDVYLYRNDIPSIVPKGSSQQDSAAIVKKYIDSWITRQLVLSKAQSGIDAEGLKKEVDEFRDMLLIGRYEQSVISRELDTTVTAGQIKAYYDENKNNFILNKDIVLWSYLPVTYCDNQLLKKLKSAFARDTEPARSRRRDADDTDKPSKPWTWEGSIEDLMSEESYNAPFVRAEWIEMENLLGKYETEKNFASNIASKSKYSFQASNDDGVYLGKIQRYVRKGSTSPLEYVSGQIKSILLNKRKVETLNAAEEILRKEAAENGKLEIFTNDENK